MTDTDLVAGAVLELYGSPAESFVAVRTAWVKKARAVKDKEAATTIAALRKPTRSAEILNLLARNEPTAIDDLLRLGADLRRAQRTVDAPLLRELTARRRTLVGDLLRLAAGIDGELSPGVRDEITATLGAALVDDDVAVGLRSGTLSKSGSWDGFGPEVSVQLSVVRNPARPESATAAEPTQEPRSHVESRSTSAVGSHKAGSRPEGQSGPATSEVGRPDLRLVPSTEPAVPDPPGPTGSARDPFDVDPWDEPGDEPTVTPGVDDLPTGDDGTDPEDDTVEPELSDRQLKDRARAIARQQVRDEEHTRRAAAQAELTALEGRRAAQRAERAEQARTEARRRLDQATSAHQLAVTGLDDLDEEIARLTRTLENLRQDRDDQADLAARAERAVQRARDELDRLDRS